MKLVSLTLSCLLIVAVGSTSAVADKADDSVSAADAKIVIDYIRGRAEGCPDCIPKGVDLEKNKVTISASDLKKRDEDIKSVTSEGPEVRFTQDDRGNFGRFIWFCKIKNKPSVKVDMAVYKMYESTKNNSPLNEVFEPMWKACGNPSNLDNQALMQKFKSIRLKVITPKPKQQFYSWDFNVKSGSLTIGVWQGASGGDDEAFKELLKGN